MITAVSLSSSFPHRPASSAILPRQKFPNL
jgi:hypothetical protein